MHFLYSAFTIQKVNVFISNIFTTLVISICIFTSRFWQIINSCLVASYAAPDSYFVKTVNSDASIRHFVNYLIIANVG